MNDIDSDLFFPVSSIGNAQRDWLVGPKRYTRGDPLKVVKISIALDAMLLRDVELWVRQGHYPHRSQAIQAALREKVERWKRTQLAEELAKLDVDEERGLADELNGT